ncbi:MAG TPA: siderophore-interacting protein [Mesorhizobium sp.]|jgi:NADPH-dependent ferric siderophore reductase|uniref:siderophore-interacting protein n=1 Tax=Mesorhizobium sp. TaxID=1871066 RepID=UPI002DDDB47B|nr:siderophore-interacting protein [Mesorhizobium sp.]HEV2503523.1 siderophore-interacting protein [Mesorhizobium sp.]
MTRPKLERKVLIMMTFSAQTRVALSDPEAIIAPVCEHMLEHGGVSRIEDGARILEFSGARARFSPTDDGTLVDVEADSLESLYFVRVAVASHILEFAEPAAPTIVWRGDGGELARPPNFQILRVANVQDITPHMRRISFRGDNVARFAGMNALHLNVLCQHPGLAAPQWPTVGGNGLAQWEDPARRPSFRKYTVRSLDVAAGRLDIDFVLHTDAGPGSALAETTQIGAEIGVVGPGGGGLVDADWYLFAGDETALPAIARMLECLPAQARGKAFIEVADKSEAQQLKFPAGIEVTWLYRNGAAAGTTSLLIDAVRSSILPDDGSSVYIWAGCEFAAFRQIRSHCRGELGLKKEQHLVVSYWNRGNSSE